MSLNTGNNGQQNKPQQAQQQANNQGQQQQAQQPQNRHFNLAEMNAALSRGGKAENTEARAGELLAALTKVGRMEVEAQNLDDGYELVRFDRDAHRVGVGALLVVNSYRNGGQVYVAVRPLLVDNKAVCLKQRTLTINNDRQEIPTYVSDTLTPEYWNRIVGHLRSVLGNPNAIIANSGYLEVPADFDVSERNFSEVSKLLIQSVNRNGDTLARVNGEKPFNLAAMRSADDVLTARLDFSGTPRYNMFGYPIRSDLTVQMNRSVRGNSDSDPFYDADTMFNSVSMYVSLEYTPTVSNNGYVQQPTDSQVFTPLIVITDVRNAGWIAANTMEQWWLAVSNAYRVTAGQAWAGVFLPAVAKKDDPRDIGAITYLVPGINAKTKTKTDTFTPQNFAELMQAFVKSTPVFALDLDPVGENGAIDTILLAAAGDGPDHDRAIKMIITALNNVTNNQFSNFFDATKHHIVRQQNTDVHRGYYISTEEERADIRDLGPLECLNAVDGNEAEFNAWYRTWFDNTIHPDVRLKLRGGYERQYLSNTLHIQGKYNRVILTKEVIIALDKAVQAAGVSVDIENVTTAYGNSRFIGNPNLGQYAVDQQAHYTGGYSNTYNVGPNAGMTSGAFAY